MKTYLTQTGAVLPLLLILQVLLMVVSPRGSNAGLLVVGALTFISFWPHRRAIDWRQAGRQFALPGVTYLCFAISAFVSPSPRALEMLRDSVIVILPLAILFVSLPLWSPELRRRAAFCFTGAFIIAFAYHASQVALNFPLDHHFGQKVAEYDIFNTNIPKRAAAVLLLLSWPAALALARYGKVLWGVALVTIIAFTLPDFVSRAAMLAGLAGWLMLMIAFLAPKLARWLSFAALPLAIPLTVLGATLLPLITGWAAPQLPHSGSARLAVWQETLLQGAHAWPLGVGLDGSRAFTPAIPTHPHNIFLQIFLEGGLWGVALVTLLLGMAWAQINRVEARLRPFVWGYAVSAVVVASIAYGLWQGWWLAAHGFAAFLLMLIASDRVVARAPATPAVQLPPQ